jgi:hypothetical protein
MSQDVNQGIISASFHEVVMVDKLRSDLCELPKPIL